MNLHETQQAAIDAAVRERFSIITGGAGTGKTTIIREIARSTPGTIHLVAFAGKAAARMREATNRPASTIHRLLGYQGTRFTREHLHGDTVIVDEASMVDSALMAEICRREPLRLVLVGDDAQLAPVGRGQPFHDLIRLRPEVVTNLTYCWRNQEAVYEAATHIRAGEQPAQQACSEAERWTVAQTGDAQQTQEMILELVANGSLEFADGLDIVLAPRNGDVDVPCSVTALNHAIVEILNPRERDQRLAPGDRAINTKNNSDLDIWNGTAGTIRAIDRDGTVYFEPDDRLGKDEIVEVPKKAAQALQLGYALTVHKAQGSQYRRVAFCCLGRDSYSLDRSLVYTAVTRTKSQCLVAGQRNALASAINKVRTKWTVLQELAK